MSTITAQRNGQTPAALRQEDNVKKIPIPRDPEFVETFQEAQALADPRESVLAKVWDTYKSLGVDPKDRISTSFQQSYLCSFSEFDRTALRFDDEQNDLRTWARVHLANTKLKLIGKNGELDLLLAAMLSCDLIGLTGTSGTGKTASVKLMLESIANNPKVINVVDCGTVYSKDQLIGHTDPDTGKFVPGLINGNSEYIVLDEFSRLHGTLQGAVVKVLDEGEIRVDGQVHKLHENVKIFVVYNGQEDGGTFGIIQALLDRLQVVINYKHVGRESTKVNSRLTNANKNWKDVVGYPDDKFRGTKLFELFQRMVETKNGTDMRIRLCDLLSDAVSESREGDFWTKGSRLSERATEILGRVGNALMAVRGIKPESLMDDGVLFGLAREVLKNTAYNQLQKNPLREETKDELFEMYLANTFEAFRASGA